MAQMQEGRVLTCMVTECNYNKGEICYAPSINVGASHPTCDTFTIQNVQMAPRGLPDIEVCDITDCQFNQNNDCMAPGITISHHSGHADCLTFRPGPK
ncbi:MAG: DUF1540 domain-containing protein [Actinobacteria bacterium]|nr:DUF1540 domain-containing protein [Actinomycetota bacterium]